MPRSSNVGSSHFYIKASQASSFVQHHIAITVFNVSVRSSGYRGGEPPRYVVDPSQLIISQTRKVDDHPEQSQSAPNQLSQSTQGEPNFGDSSEPLFSIYSKNAEEEDNKTAERWQKDADGVLIFVSLCVDI